MKSAIGVDIRGTNIKIIHTSEEGKVLTRLSEPIPNKPGEPSDNLKNTLIKILKNILPDDVTGIGFGIAGIIDRRNGIVKEPPNIPSINGFPVFYLIQCPKTL